MRGEWSPIKSWRLGRRRRILCKRRFAEGHAFAWCFGLELGLEGNLTTRTRLEGWSRLPITLCGSVADLDNADTRLLAGSLAVRSVDQTLFTPLESGYGIAALASSWLTCYRWSEAMSHSRNQAISSYTIRLDPSFKHRRRPPIINNISQPHKPLLLIVPIHLLVHLQSE
jgi:hypothetical protein